MCLGGKKGSTTFFEQRADEKREQADKKQEADARIAAAETRAKTFVDEVVIGAFEELRDGLEQRDCTVQITRSSDTEASISVAGHGTTVRYAVRLNVYPDSVVVGTSITGRRRSSGSLVGEPPGGEIAGISQRAIIDDFLGELRWAITNADG